MKEKYIAYTFYAGICMRPCLTCKKVRPVARHSRCLECARARDRAAKKREAAKRAEGILPPRDRTAELAAQRRRYAIRKLKEKYQNYRKKS